MPSDTSGHVTEGSVKGKTQWSYQLGFKYLSQILQKHKTRAHLAKACRRALAVAYAREEPRSLSSLRDTGNEAMGVGTGRWIRAASIWWYAQPSLPWTWLHKVHPQMSWTYFLLGQVEDLNSQFSSVQFSSVAQSCPTLCDLTDCSMPGFLVHHQLLELTQTHVHRVGNAIQPSHPLSSPAPPAFNLSQHQGLSQWVSSLHQVTKVFEVQLQHQSFQWIFRTDFL